MKRKSKQSWTISELGALHGLSRSTLLYYDRLGLLRPSGRTSAGYRIYDAAARERLGQICRYRELGLGLEAIREVLACGKRPSRRVLRQRLAEIEDQTRQLQSHHSLIEAMLDRMTSGQSEPAVDKALWVEMLRVAGMDEAAMRRWHISFEQRAPRGHDAFLRSLGISADEIERIRAWSQAAD